jgi:DNA polymerase-1
VATTWGLEDHDRATFDDNRKLMERLLRTSNALVPVELEGIGVDIPYLESLEVEWEGKLHLLTKKLVEFMPDPPGKKTKKNPNSVPQVTRTLQELGVPFVQSTDAEHLVNFLARATGKLKDFLDLLLEYRKEQKLYSTYISGARKRLYNGRLYPTFLLHGTTSGRLSCRNPNLFNIPRGSNIRRMFVPERGQVYVQADFSQVEWRVVACLAQDEFLHEVFSDPTRDIHSEVAKRLGITRQRAKTVVYGSTYGMEAAHLGQLLDVPVNTAGRILREFFSVIPQVVEWQKSIKTKLFTEHDDLVTPYGRHRRFWLITDENKKDVYKEALSFLPQSIAADICQEAMNDLLERGFKCRLSVYDSIMLECDEANAKEYGEIMREAMLTAGRNFSDYVPFEVEVKTGHSWGEFG